MEDNTEMTIQRLAGLTEAELARGLSAVAVVPGPNLRYLTGLDFHQGKRLTVAFFPADGGEPAFVLPAMEAARVRANSRVPLRLFPWGHDEEPDGALRRCVDDLGLSGGGGVAVEYTTMRVFELRAVEAALDGAPAEDATPLLMDLRMVKDASELAAMETAARMIETALEAVIVRIRPGVTERELAAIWVGEILATGSEGPSFPVAVASGPNGAFPHHENGDRAFAPGDLIVLDGGALVDGYASDITRTVALGEPGAEKRRVYELVKAANAAGRAAARPGATGHAIDAAARGVIEEGGMGERFLHRTGHGLGLEIHEPPYIAVGNHEPLPEGATFTIEPGIYVEGLGGVRIEDDVVLTAEGARSLTHFERDLIVLPV